MFQGTGTYGTLKLILDYSNLLRYAQLFNFSLLLFMSYIKEKVIIRIHFKGQKNVISLFNKATPYSGIKILTTNDKITLSRSHVLINILNVV